MRLLVTAGNTQVPIDKVRCITNIFTGRTGAGLALFGHTQGHDTTLLTSHPEVVADLQPNPAALGQGWHVEPYRTFDDLHGLLESAVRGGSFDTIIHCAAVGDYLSAGVYAPDAGSHFDPTT